MAYKLPSDEEIEDIIGKVMEIRRIVESQAELRREVEKHLQRRNKDYKISGKRLRKIALKMENIKVEIRCKLTNEEVEDMKTCPVCGSKMEKIGNMTLEGEKITIGFKCTFCPYWTGNRLRIPIRYIFRIR